MKLKSPYVLRKGFCGPTRARTKDPLIMSQNISLFSIFSYFCRLILIYSK